MRIISQAFTDADNIPAKYTCDGQNVSPPLEFTSVPPDAKSLALVVDDPDAPAGVWDHWIVYNIPPNQTKIDEGAAPSGLIGKNSSGNQAFDGPCPPKGSHRYFFKLYALDCLLDLPAGVNKADLMEAMQGHIIAQAELVGMYERK